MWCQNWIKLNYNYYPKPPEGKHSACFSDLGFQLVCGVYIPPSNNALLPISTRHTILSDQCTSNLWGSLTQAYMKITSLDKWLSFYSSNNNQTLQNFCLKVVSEHSSLGIGGQIQPGMVLGYMNSETNCILLVIYHFIPIYIQRERKRDKDIDK